METTKNGGCGWSTGPRVGILSHVRRSPLLLSKSAQTSYALAPASYDQAYPTVPTTKGIRQPPLQAQCTTVLLDPPLQSLKSLRDLIELLAQDMACSWFGAVSGPSTHIMGLFGALGCFSDIPWSYRAPKGCLSRGSQAACGVQDRFPLFGRFEPFGPFRAKNVSFWP